jgi:hypothetical protein
MSDIQYNTRIKDKVINMGDMSVENVTELQHFGTTMANQNYIQEVTQGNFHPRTGHEGPDRE